MKEELFRKYKEIESDRLLLRHMTSQDVNDLFEIYSNKEVMLYFADRAAFTDISEAEKMISGYNEGLQNKWEMRWGIVLKESGKLIGTCGFHAISDYDKRIEIGYDLNRDYWGKKIMKEALSLIIDFAYKESDVNRIEAYVEPPNVSSRTLLERLGFVLEGTLRKHEMCRGELIDIQILSLLREDWNSIYVMVNT
ncbi:MAG: GNAT family N-acetyltransferase [Lachnospiraceae bacterium]|nr:GNAT family N-acetyltransferase [Lachnospiraceae bacterium]